MFFKNFGLNLASLGLLCESKYFTLNSVRKSNSSYERHDVYKYDILRVCHTHTSNIDDQNNDRTEMDENTAASGVNHFEISKSNDHVNRSSSIFSYSTLHKSYSTVQ